MSLQAFVDFSHPPTFDGPEWRAHDGRLGVFMRGSVWAWIEARCAASGRLETGGLLVGQYGPEGDRALIEAVCAAPADSRRSPMGFLRGQEGLEAWLGDLWGLGRHYLGEWHLHPRATCAASHTDLHSLVSIARDPGYRCDKPLLLVVGGSPGAWRSGLWVVRRGRPEELRGL